VFVLKVRTADVVTIAHKHGHDVALGNGLNPLLWAAAKTGRAAAARSPGGGREVRQHHSPVCDGCTSKPAVLLHHDPLSCPVHYNTTSRKQPNLRKATQPHESFRCPVHGRSPPYPHCGALCSRLTFAVSSRAYI
jgi:hypothetical protein